MIADPANTVTVISEAYANRGVAYEKLNQHDRAIKDFNEAIRLDQSDATAFRYRGVAHQAKGGLGRT